MNPVTLLSLDYPPNDGGIARLCGELALILQRNDALAEVIAQSWDIPSRSGPATTYPDATRLTPRRPVRELAAFKCLLKSQGGVLASIWYPDGLLAVLARRRPLVILAHGLELMPTRARWRRRPWAWLCRGVLERADLILANSEYTSGLVQNVAPAARTEVIPLAVDHRRFSPRDRVEAKRKLGVDGKHVISTVARVHPYKGHDLVLHALATLAPEIREDLQYLIAGRGPHVPALRELARELQIAEQVRWLGFVPENDLPDLYRASDLFVMCTRELPDMQEVEGFGLTFLEAQACATPVIGTRTGGIPDAVEDGFGGWLIAQDDIQTLSSHLRRVVLNPQIYAEFGTMARRRVEQGFTWMHYEDRLLAHLKSAGFYK